MKVLVFLISCCVLNLHAWDKSVSDQNNIYIIKSWLHCNDVEVLKNDDPETIVAYKVELKDDLTVRASDSADVQRFEYEVKCKDKVKVPANKRNLLSASGCYNVPVDTLSVDLDYDNTMLEFGTRVNNGPFVTVTKILKGETIADMLSKYSGRMTERAKLVGVFQYLAKNLARLATYGCNSKENHADGKLDNSTLIMDEFAFDKVFILGDKAKLDDIAFSADDAPVYQNLSKVLLALSFTNIVLNNVYMNKIVNCDSSLDYNWRSVTMYDRILLAANLLNEYSSSKDLSSEECTKINDVLRSDFREKLLRTFDDVEALYGEWVWGRIMRRYDAIEALEVFETAMGKIWKLYRCLMDGKLIIKGDEPSEQYMDAFKERILVYDPITGSDRPYLNEKGLFERLKGWAKHTAVAKLFKKVLRIRDLYRTRNCEFKDVLDSYIQKFSDAKLP